MEKVRRRSSAQRTRERKAGHSVERTTGRREAEGVGAFERGSCRERKIALPPTARQTLKQHRGHALTKFKSAWNGERGKKVGSSKKVPRSRGGFSKVGLGELPAEGRGGKKNK